MKRSNNLENKTPLDTYWRVQLICKKVLAHSSLEPPVALIKKLTNIDRCLTDPANWFLTNINPYYISYSTYPVLVILTDN